MFRLRFSWLAWWRVLWLAGGLAYAWSSLSAEVHLASLFDGHERTGEEVMGIATDAVSRFPFDPHLRDVLTQLAQMVGAATRGDSTGKW
jgi:hypothetical protein